MDDTLPPVPPPDGWPATAPDAPPSGLPPTRPRLVTAVGVLSLVVALLGVVGAAATALWGVAFYASAYAASAAAAREMAVRRSTLFVPEPPSPVVEAGADGLTQPLRDGIVDAFSTVRPLRPQRVQQLDAMLARHGRSILLRADDRAARLEPSPDRVRGLVVDHGELFSANRAAAPEYFQLSTGRLELYDDRSVFYPADGSRTLRSSLPRPATRPAPPPPPPAPVPSMPALVVVLAASVAGAALSVLLFIAAVLWLRGSPSGRRMHAVWAWLKMVVVLTAAVAFWWMTRDFYGGFTKYVAPLVGPGAAPPAQFVVKPWHPIVVGVAGLLYPLAVLVILRSRAVREHFSRGE